MKNRYIVTSLMMLIIMSISACDRPTPEQLRERHHLPEPGFKGDVAIGKSLFDAKCSRCHGVNGRGTGLGPALVDKVYRPGHHSDLTFHSAIKMGARQHHWHFGNMPAIDGVSPEDAAHIIAYVRHEQRQAGIR